MRSAASSALAQTTFAPDPHRRQPSARRSCRVVAPIRDNRLGSEQVISADQEVRSSNRFDDREPQDSRSRLT